MRRACVKLGHPIRLISEAMRGTEFRVGLPLVDGQPVHRALHEDADVRNLRRRVALVVENDDAMRRAYEVILTETLGMIPRMASGTDEALATMGEEPPDVLIADYSLENGDTGLVAIDALRAAAGQPVPAVIVTAHRDPEIARACAARGVPLLEKPLSPADLGKALLGLLQ